MTDHLRPVEVSRLLVSLLEDGDLDAVMNLYEDDSVFADFDGVAEGVDSIRAAHERFMASGLTLSLNESLVFEADDIALVQWAWTVTGLDGSMTDGVSAEVLRRQADGNWKFLIDNPDGAALVGRI